MNDVLLPCITALSETGCAQYSQKKTIMSIRIRYCISAYLIKLYQHDYSALRYGHNKGSLTDLTATSSARLFCAAVKFKVSLFVFDEGGMQDR